MKNGFPLVRSLDRLGQRRDARVLPQLIAQQRPDRLRSQRLEWQLLVVRPLHPARLVLGTEGDEPQIAGGGHALDGRLEEGVAGAVEPVQVLEQEHPLPAVGRVVKHPLHHAVQPLLPLLGVDCGGRVRRVRHAEQVEEKGQHLAEALVHQQQPPGDLRPRRLGAVAVGDPEEGTPELQHGQHRDRLPVRYAVPLEHRNAARPAAIEELRAQARLARARLGHHPHHLAAAAARALQRGLEHRHVAVAPDEARQAAGAGHFERSVERAHALQFVDPHRSAYPFELERAEIAQAEEPRNQLRAVLG